MRTRTQTILIALCVFFASSPYADHHEGGGRGGRGEHLHGKANRHMHQTSFEDLVQGFESADRVHWQKPGEIIDRLEPLHGKTVADIGAGSGYFAFRMAKFAESVIAIDIDQRMLDYIEVKKLDEAVGDNIETRITTHDNPGLRDGEADIVLIVNTYHHIENRPTYLDKVRRGMKEGGRLVIVDYFKRPLPFGPPPEIKLDPSQVVAELEAAGLDVLRVDEDLLEYQYMITSTR